MKTNKWIYAIMLASLVWVSCDDDDDNIIDPALNDTDERFVQMTAENNMAQLEFSQLAVTKAQDSAVRSLAQEMIEAHTTAQDELEDIADDFRDVEWPDDLDEGDDAVRDQLDSMTTGYSFDTLFLGSQRRLHEAARATLESAATTVTETRLKDYATKYLPHIEAHLQHVDSVQTVVSNNNASDTADVTDATN